jgi:WD40 repeat protein
VELNGPAERAFLSPSGRYLAIAVRGEEPSLEVWDLEASRHIFHVKSDGAVAVDFSADEQLLLEMTHGDLRVFDLASRKRLRRIKCEGAWSACFDPHALHVVVANHEHVALYDWQDGKRVRRWLLGETQHWEEVVEAMRDEVQESFEEFDAPQTERHLRRMNAHLNLPETMVQEVMAEVQKAQREMLANLDSEEFMEQAVCGSEHALRVAFDSSGKLLVCGTSRGVQIFHWDEMLHHSTPIPGKSGKASDRAAPPPPQFTAESEPYAEEGEEEYHELADDASVYALACDADNRLVLYAGAGGVVSCLDLDTGRTRRLLEIPGRPTIHGLTLSRDGASLACTTFPQIYRDTPKTTPEFFVWDYAALRGMDTLA